MTDTTTELKPAENIQAVCDELGLTMTAEFVPFSKSRNAKPDTKDGKVWKSLNWRVTLRKAAYGLRADNTAGGPIREILTTDYGQGVAHCPAYKNPVKFPGSGRVDKYLTDRAVAHEIEHGHTERGRKKIEAPSIVDVVASLVVDAGVLDSSTFEDWASEFGYDTDSRKGEATYRACLEIALKLRNGIGEAGLAKLREACQDY